MMITLLRPIWLLLLIPIVVAIWRLPMPTRFLQTLRVTTLMLVLTGMIGLALRLPIQSGTVVVVVDRSLSMPANSDSAAKETIDYLSKSMGPRDKLGVVSFGEKATVEQAPEHASFSGFIQDVGSDGSRLSDGIEKALALIPRDSPGAVVVLSDGKWTGPDPINVAARAADRGVRLDYRSLSRPGASDLAIAKFDTPMELASGESYTLAGFVRSPVEQDVSVELKRNGQRISAGKQHMMTGINRVVFRDTAEEPGTLEYELVVRSDAPDPIPENNTARALVGVEGAKPILLVADAENSDLAALLKAGRLNIKVKTPEEVNWSLEGLSSYSGVILENVPATAIGTSGMETVAAWVQNSAGGLALTGGRKSFGPGGYFKSPLDPIMPVSMELRQEHRKLAMAMVVAMDRSGSMGAPAGNGRAKMDLADLGAAQVLECMSPMDELGVIAVDTEPHTMVELGPVGDSKAQSKNKILSIGSEGGGIYIDVAMHASAEMILKSHSDARHIILFADAADSEQGGDYKETVDRCQKAGITVSVVGMGGPSDCDVNLLKDIAARGKGRFYLTNNLDELPRIFAQETFVVARSTFIETASAVKLTGGMTTLSTAPFSPPPAVGGYNLTYLKPGANLAIVTNDEYKAPLVAAWQAGLGRVAAYTGEASGKYTGPIAKWAQVGEMHASIARWIGEGKGGLPNGMLVTQEIRSGVNMVQLHLDPARPEQTLFSIPVVTTLRGRMGQTPTAEKEAMRWTNADLLEVAIPLRGDQTSLSTVTIPGVGQVSLPPVCLPYSSEFEPAAMGGGAGNTRATSLEQLAHGTGGEELVNLEHLWQELPRVPRYVDLGPWVLCAAALVLLLEVFERRTGLLSAGLPLAGIGALAGAVSIFKRGGKSEATERVTETGPVPPWMRNVKKEKPLVEGSKKVVGPGVVPPVKGSVSDSLREARERARGQTGDRK